MGPIGGWTARSWAWDGTGLELLDFFMGSPYLEWKVVCKLPKSFIQYNRSTPTKPERSDFRQVRLHVLLAKDGTVEEIEALSGHPLLQNAALEAVRKWRYRPTLVNSIPVEVDTFVEVTFPPSK